MLSTKPLFDVQAANKKCPIKIEFHTCSVAKDFQETFHVANRLMFAENSADEKGNFSYHSAKIRGLVQNYTRDNWPIDVATPLLKSGGIFAHACTYAPHLLGDRLLDNYLIYLGDETTHAGDDHYLHPLFAMVLTADGENVFIREFCIPGPCPPAQLQASAAVDAVRRADAARRAKEEKGSMSRRLRSAVCCAAAPPARTATDRIAEDLDIQKMVHGTGMKTLSVKTPIQKVKMPWAPKRSMRVTLGEPLLGNVKGQVVETLRV